jgi:hypothetical protein
MKKSLVTFLALFGAIFMQVRAQSDFAPDTLFPLSDFGITVPVPSIWTYRVGDAYYFGADDSAIDAVADNDPNSAPFSPVLVIQAFRLNNLRVTDDATLDTVFPIVADVLGIQANNETSETAVNGKRVLSAFGQAGSAGAIVSVWLQDQQALALALFTPDANVGIYGSAYELTLNNISMTDAEDLDETVGSAFGFDIQYPRGWTPLNLETQGLFGLFEDTQDAQAIANGSGDAIQGIVFSVTVRPYSELRLTNRTTLSDLIALLGNTIGDKDLVYEGDFFVNELAGTGVSGLAQNGRYQVLVATLNDDTQTLTLYAISAQDERTLRQFMPTFLMMLQSITPDN